MNTFRTQMLATDGSGQHVVHVGHDVPTPTFTLS